MYNTKQTNFNGNFFLALRGSSFVFSLPCLNKRKNNGCWENVKKKAHLRWIYFFVKCEKNSAERNFPLSRHHVPLFCLLLNSHKEIKSLILWQLPYFILSVYSSSSLNYFLIHLLGTFSLIPFYILWFQLHCLMMMVDFFQFIKFCSKLLLLVKQKSIFNL